MPGKDIKITITDETGRATREEVSNESLTTQTATEKVSPTTTTGATNKMKSKGVAIGAMVASKSFSYVTSNIGKWTGSNARQQTINNIQQGASIAMLAAINPYVAIASVGLNIATTIIDETYERKWSERSARQAQARAGYSSTGEVVGRRH